MSLNPFRIVWKEYDLGLSPEFVSLEPYSIKWSEAYSKFCSLFNEHLKEVSTKFHHIGSTSVHSPLINGIKSKPIIDILGEVSDLNQFDSLKEKLESFGFEWKGENSIQGRRLLELKSWRGPEVFFHIHIFQQNSPEIEKHLLFRDYLNAHPLVAQAYQDQKMRLQSVYEYKRDTYSETKASMIHDIVAKARFWKEKLNV